MQRCLTSLVVREMEITTPYLLEWLKWRRRTILNVGEDVEELELSHTSGGNVKWDTLQKQFDSFLNVKPHTHLPYDLAIYWRKESIWTHNDLYTNVHSSCICNIPKLENNQISINKWLSKQMASPYLESLCHATRLPRFQGREHRPHLSPAGVSESQCKRSTWEERDCWTCHSVPCMFPWEYPFHNPTPRVKVRTQNHSPTAWVSARLSRTR